VTIAVRPANDGRTTASPSLKKLGMAANLLHRD
jgi:hypothetical protein